MLRAVESSSFCWLLMAPMWTRLVAVMLDRTQGFLLIFAYCKAASIRIGFVVVCLILLGRQIQCKRFGRLCSCCARLCLLCRTALVPKMKIFDQKLADEDGIAEMRQIAIFSR